MFKLSRSHRAVELKEAVDILPCTCNIDIRRIVIFRYSITTATYTFTALPMNTIVNNLIRDLWTRILTAFTIYSIEVHAYMLQYNTIYVRYHRNITKYDIPHATYNYGMYNILYYIVIVIILCNIYKYKIYIHIMYK